MGHWAYFANFPSGQKGDSPRQAARRFEAQIPQRKAQKMDTRISTLQANFCKAFKFNTPRADQMKPTGEIDGDFIWVYKLGTDEPWTFKAAVPIGPGSAKAVAVYLDRLQAIAPNHAGRRPQYAAMGDDQAEAQ